MGDVVDRTGRVWLIGRVLEARTTTHPPTHLALLLHHSHHFSRLHCTALHLRGIFVCVAEMQDPSSGPGWLTCWVVPIVFSLRACVRACLHVSLPVCVSAMTLHGRGICKFNVDGWTDGRGRCAGSMCD